MPQVHIHSGATCTGNAGGHFYTGSVTSDPWTSIAYTSTDGTATGSVTVNTGASSASLIGLAFIVHGYDGGRIGCAILGAVTEVSLTASGFVRRAGSNWVALVGVGWRPLAS